jgi:hypothetical protein
LFAICEAQSSGNLATKQDTLSVPPKKSAPFAESRARKYLIPRLPACYPELAPPTQRTSGTIDLACSDLCLIEHKFLE